LLWVCYGIAHSYQVFVRRNFGPTLLDQRGGIAFIVMLAVMTFRHSVGMAWYLWAFVGFQILQRVCTHMRRRGHRGHSRDGAYPWFGFMFTRKMPDAVGAETLIGVMAGIGITVYGQANHIPPLLEIGGWVMLASFVSMGVEMMEAALLQKWLQDMEDAQYEHEYLMEQYRQRMKRR
jgi:hypothetical protein